MVATVTTTFVECLSRVVRNQADLHGRFLLQRHPSARLAQELAESEAEDSLETIGGETTQLALVKVSRADDGERGTLLDVASIGSERRFTTGGGSFRGAAPTIADLMLPKSRDHRLLEAFVGGLCPRPGGSVDACIGGSC